MAILKRSLVTADQGVVGVCTPDNSRYPFIVMWLKLIHIYLKNKVFLHLWACWNLYWWEQLVSGGSIEASFVVNRHMHKLQYVAFIITYIIRFQKRSIRCEIKHPPQFNVLLKSYKYLLWSNDSSCIILLSAETKYMPYWNLLIIHDKNKVADKQADQ